MINIPQIRELIDETMLAMGDRFFSKHASDLVFETGLVESRYEYLMQLGSGPAKSFFQVEPSSAVDNIANYLSFREIDRTKMAEASFLPVEYWESINENFWENLLKYNIACGIIHCRLKYWRAPEKLPTTLEERASYWKQFYNTAEGAGTESHYIEIVEAYNK